MGRPADPNAWAERRARMVADQLAARGIRQPEVLEAMARVPRERFVAAEMSDRSYDDAALAIAGGQTISQPYIVARMTEELDLPGWRSRHAGRIPRVLDVGTGSGYQAAVLHAMGARVIGIERDADLARAAEERLHALGMRVRVVVGDGTEGWPDESPYAGIVAAAAAPGVPPPLLEQLADGGRLVIPIGTRSHQELRVVRRVGERMEWRSVEPCVFVPLVGRYGFDASR
jgi:protein-L-isoaspartate(D-aspartate) O-methyltransferase